MIPVANRARVLVVEDDPDLRAVYRTALMAAGYAVVAVEDGIDALRCLDREPAPSAVVLDIGLPRLDGRDLGRELRARPDTRHVPIVVVTGTDLDLTGLEFDCMIRKPVLPETLVSVVDGCVRDRSGVVRN